MKRPLVEPKPAAARMAVVHVELPVFFEKDTHGKKSKSLQNIESKLEEAINLSQALANVKVIHTSVIELKKKVNPKTVIGGGKVEDLKAIFDKENIEVVVINTSLTPSQQRNLETALDVKVLDRANLILEIFAARARTKVGRLQVALAKEIHLQSRLVRAWLHLERQRGGMSKTGGPGERQIELDKRMIRDKIKIIREQLKKVEKGREQQRSLRKKAGLQVVSLVGYTNAGKSTLFNYITAKYGVKASLDSSVLEDEAGEQSNGEAFVEDMLFATLDPLMRKIKLPSGREVILSDTVGFISDLPHELVDAFASTLEEVTLSDLLLHVEDVASEDRASQSQDVHTVLKSIKANEIELLEVLNKSDKLSADKQDSLDLTIDEAKQISISAITGEYVEELLAMVEEKLSGDEEELDIKVSIADGKKLAWLHENAKVISQELQDDFWKIRIKIASKFVGEL